MTVSSQVEGFDPVVVLRTPDEIDALVIARRPVSPSS